MNKIKLILDLDGVLIITPLWRSDEIDIDGYSKFNKTCVDNLNKLLLLEDFDIWLSSARRTTKTLDEFNIIFKVREINTPIRGFIPIYDTRHEEITRFVENLIGPYIIIDDDKSLYDLPQKVKDHLILTDSMKGFDHNQLKIAKKIIKK